MKELVCFFKEFDQTYVDLFKSKYETKFVELIKITPYNHLSIESIFTSEKIKEYDTLIITSKNTVAILNEVLQNHGISNIPNISTYIISEKNANNLHFQCKDIIFANGYAKDLCQKMENNIINGTITKVLFICGDKRLDTIPNFLQKHNIIFDELNVYKTDHIVNHEVKKNILNLTQDYEKIFMVFFSPTGIKSFIDMFDTVKNDVIWKNDKIKFVTIGTTTSKPLKNIKDDIIIANLPENQYIFEAINQ